MVSMHSGQCWHHTTSGIADVTLPAHLRTVMRCLRQMPRPPPVDLLLRCELYQEYAQTIDVNRKSAPLARQLFRSRSRSRGRSLAE